MLYKSAKSQRSLCLGLAIFSLCLAVSAVETNGQAKPRFEQYPVKTVYKGKPARVNLRSAKGARYYRTMLRETAKEGANFAGHYAIGIWGCGSPCLIGGMVDLKTGKVTWVPDSGVTVLDIAFRLNSRLVILNSREVLDKASPNGPPAWLGEWPEELFFVWDGKRFVQIR